jgi:hypothetical protein
MIPFPFPFPLPLLSFWAVFDKVQLFCKYELFLGESCMPWATLFAIEEQQFKFN